MKITCQSCQAKYTIADEKVVGKIVKIRCKKCSATIVVNGDASASSPREAGEGAAADDSWSVHVAEGDQRTLSEADLIAAYQSGVVEDETFCWRDGMSDWLPLREIEHLYAACAATRAAQENGAGAAHELASAPLAARRAGGRAPAGDLFGGAAQAGSEQDVLTSAPEKIPEAQVDPRTGARNESSVLFSLSALTSKGNNAERPLPMPGSEQSGLIDIRQLSAQMGKQESKKKSRFDDIMNLTGGGAFSPSLGGPPMLAAPAMEQYGAMSADGTIASADRRKKLILLGSGAFVLVAAICWAAVVMYDKAPEGAKGASAAAATSPTAPAASVAVAAPSTSDTAATAATTSASGTAPDAPPKASANKGTSAAPATTAKAAAPPKAAATAATGLAAAMAAGAAPAAAAPAAAAESDAPFNMGEAKSKLAAMAGSLDACKKPGGPTGTGRVVVMFAPSGAAQSAAVSGPPFEGTPTGTCVAARFRSVRVPAFGGSPFSVSKSFTIN